MLLNATLGEDIARLEVPAVLGRHRQTIDQLTDRTTEPRSNTSRGSATKRVMPAPPYIIYRSTLIGIRTGAT